MFYNLNQLTKGNLSPILDVGTSSHLAFAPTLGGFLIKTLTIPCIVKNFLHFQGLPARKTI